MVDIYNKFMQIRKKGFEKENFIIKKNEKLKKSVKFEIRFVIDLSKSDAKKFSLFFNADENFENKCEIKFDLKKKIIFFIPGFEKEKIKFPFELYDEHLLKFEIYNDISSCEILINESKFVMHTGLNPNNNILLKNDGKLLFRKFAFYSLEDCETEKMLEASNKFIESRMNMIKGPHKLKYHLIPPTGWMNDPNGAVFHNGRHHLFYQAYPFEPKNGYKHWVHFSSADLAEWKIEPTAIAPNMPYDLNGCYSGSAISFGGDLYLMYTGHLDFGDPKEVQCIAKSTDGRNFIKYEKNPVITPGSEFEQEFRDPKIWEKDGVFYTVIGNCKNGSGQILLYKSLDLYNWEFLSVMLEGAPAEGEVWECPDIFHLGNVDILIISLAGKSHDVIYSVGKLDYNTGRFEGSEFKLLDLGPDFYAPQSYSDNSRRILFGWMDNWESVHPTEKYNWAGAMSVPRMLSEKDGYLIQKPILENREILFFDKGFSLKQGEIREIYSGEPCFVLKGIASGSLCVKIQNFADFYYNSDGNTIILERNILGDIDKIIKALPEKPDSAFEFEICVDSSSIEIFMFGGIFTFTARVYPENITDSKVILYAENDLLIKEIELSKPIEIKYII